VAVAATPAMIKAATVTATTLFHILTSRFESWHTCKINVSDVEDGEALLSTLRADRTSRLYVIVL
jgi:hypothetical protein